MKKLCTIAALVGVLTALSASAMEVNVTRTAGYFTLPGGEFTITSTDSSFGDILTRYSAGTIVNGGFQTFCINTGISIKGNPLDATIGSDGVSLGAGYLYSQFAKGSLAGYSYTPGVDRAVSAWALQNAIWALQKQHVFDQTAANTFLTSGQFTAAMGNLNPYDVGGEVYGVRQLLMDKITVGTTGANGTVITPSQPMLVLVPDGGMTLMLLGFALSGLGLISRKVGI